MARHECNLSLKWSLEIPQNWVGCFFLIFYFKLEIEINRISKIDMISKNKINKFLKFLSKHIMGIDGCKNLSWSAENIKLRDLKLSHDQKTKNALRIDIDVNNVSCALFRGKTYREVAVVLTQL